MSGRGRLLIGTCSWTDKSLIDAASFYPKKSMSAEARLNYYADNFPIVEIDSSYYAVPSPENAVRWVERTPDDFRFDIKAYGLFTQHPVQPLTFPQDLKQALSPELAAKRRVYGKDLPEEITDELWARYREVLEILRDGNKLGVVLFQFPPWFVIGRTSREWLLECQRRLDGFKLAVEFRGGLWMEPRNQDETLGWLKRQGLLYVSVDAPQGFTSSTPPVAASTGDIALVRFHGRNTETWESASGSPSDRFDYYYEAADLREWAPKVHTLQETANEVHLLMNTNKGDQGIVNARRLAEILGENLPGVPEQAALL